MVEEVNLVKQKHWQVSVFDKTSETIKDDTFYTTDTEAYLVFELIDDGFKPDFASLTVYNVNGKATIHLNVDVVDGIVRYEIPQEAIEHLGVWRTQVIFTKNGEDYTTSIIEFEVSGHLLDKKKPKVVAITNWNHFIKHAGGLVDAWEHLEKIRQVNEQQRELAESKRQNEFRTNETRRQSTFETNEDERESTFEINESTRQANELIREEAEVIRLASEVDRINAENIRAEFYEGFDGEISTIKTEIEKKANRKQEDWITPTLLNGWTEGGAGVKYMKDEFGVVRLDMSIVPGSGDMFVFPVGYRPNKTMDFPCQSGTGFGVIRINRFGIVQRSVGTGAYVLAHGITFRVEE